MDQETIYRMNETIALFMGYEKYEDEYGVWFKYDVLIKCLHPNLQSLEYHSSWEWLMLVVEKIESIYDDFHGYFGVHISSNSCCIQGTKLRTEPGREHYAYFNEVTHDTKLSATYNAVYSFIQWYRKQNNATNVVELVFTDKERKLLWQSVVLNQLILKTYLSMSNTQLPAEWVDKLNTEALEKYPVQLHRVQNGLPTDLKEYERQLWLTGATEYAIKLHQTQQQLDKAKEALKAAQKQAIEVHENHFMCMCPDPLHLINEALSAGEGEKPAKEIEYMPVHSADVRNPGCPLQIPMHLLNEDQAQHNHGQSLKRLKDRGGLSVTEMLAIIQRRKWQSMKWDDALKMLNDILNKEVDNG